MIRTHVGQGDRFGGHTFAHPLMALHGADWISPEFELWVDERIDGLPAPDEEAFDDGPRGRRVAIAFTTRA